MLELPRLESSNINDVVRNFGKSQRGAYCVRDSARRLRAPK